MDYAELYIPVCDSQQAEIWVAELAGLPFESFDTDDTSLKAYIRSADLEANRAAVDEFIRSTGVQCSLRIIETQNWNAQWESQFDPVDVDGRCVIRAPFHDAVAGIPNVVIMPKMSFGTGHHATTWLMSSFIMDMDLEGLSGLDMGSGTGVLAILAVMRGAEHVTAIDIDEWAYENSVENIAANGVEGRINPVMGDVQAIAGQSYDFILANINRNILLADMTEYAATLVEGGSLVVSGILEQDITAITGCASANGLEQHEIRTREGWAAVSFVKEK